MLKKPFWDWSFKHFFIVGITLIGIACFQHFLFKPNTKQEPIRVYPTDVDTGGTSQTRLEQKTEVSPNGHFHEDGTWHAEPHAPQTNPASTHTPILAGEKTTPPGEAGADVDYRDLNHPPHIRDWIERNDANEEALRAQTEKLNQTPDEFTAQLAAYLMTLPIEERQSMFDLMQRQMIESGPQGMWEEYSARLYRSGLDFQTELSPEAAEARYQQILEKMLSLSKQQLETVKDGTKILEKSRELREELDY